MTRTTAWLSVVSCAALLAAVSMGGCGSSTPAGTGKGGSGGNHDGGAGAGGATGVAGDNGTGGSTAGAGGGAAGAAGGAAGAAAGADGGSAGATAGAGGGTAGATDGGTDATGGAKADGGDAASDTSSDVPPTPCVAGGTCGDPDFTCTITRTCRRNQEQFCFCDPNGKIACEACDTVDAGTDAATDAGSDAGSSDASTDGGADGPAAIPACPANVMSRTTTCDTFNDRCAMGACTNMRQAECLCFMTGVDAGRWICGLSARCQ